MLRTKHQSRSEQSVCIVQVTSGVQRRNERELAEKQNNNNNNNNKNESLDNCALSWSVENHTGLSSWGVEDPVVRARLGSQVRLMTLHQLLVGGRSRWFGLWRGGHGWRLLLGWNRSRGSRFLLHLWLADFGFRSLKRGNIIKLHLLQLLFTILSCVRNSWSCLVLSDLYKVVFIFFPTITMSCIMDV